MKNLTILAVHCMLACAGVLTAAQRPNFVIIFTDDQGYGDLGCFGSTTIRTPRIDALARDGTRFTSFYAQVVCGPSRSALLTGRYPIRSGGWAMPASEVTIAELLQKAGYRTGCIGKWDVSSRAAIPTRMPNAQGFDYYWGTLGANDLGGVVLYENNQPIEYTRDMASLTRRYTDKAIDFLRNRKGNDPFFLYLAHTMPHALIDASPSFKGKSKGDLYGDVIEELDHETGRLLDAIDQLGLRQNTIVLFTSDNGPWSNIKDILRVLHNGKVAWGSAGPLRGAKGSSYEGGLRVPCVVRWPGRVPAGHVSDAIFATIDLMPTIASLAGINPPTDRAIDGIDQTNLLLGKAPTGARDHLYYFCRDELHAVRKGSWKYVLPNKKLYYAFVADRGSNKPELYDLSQDIGETTNLALNQPGKLRELQELARWFQLDPVGPRK